jgi:Myo-inositol oxygenase
MRKEMTMMMGVRKPTKDFIKRRLNQLGIRPKDFVNEQMSRLGYLSVPRFEPLHTIEEFHSYGAEIRRNSRQQTLEEVAQLRKKYEEPILGEISVYRLLELLAQIIDPTMDRLYCVSQLAHTLQVLESMEEAGITDREFLATVLIHDLGKLAAMKGEKWENIEGGGKIPLGQNVPGSGLANCTFNWDHADIVHARFKPYVSKDMQWMIQWHSIQTPCEPLMDAHDRVLFDKYFKLFVRHDRTFIFYHRPKKRLDDYIPLLNEFYPEKILF